MCEAARKPLNVWSRSDEQIGRLMSNFAHTPFVLDGVEFASVEGFWTRLIIDGALRSRDTARRLWGAPAKWHAPKTRPAQITYNGATVPVGSDAHIELMKRAIRAKLRKSGKPSWQLARVRSSTKSSEMIESTIDSAAY